MPVIALAAVAGVALGVVGRASDYGGADSELLFVLGAPWFVVAFATGAAARRPASGALGGALALGLSVTVYYGLMLGLEGRIGTRDAVAMTVLWGLAALVCGALFGAVGTLARTAAPGHRALAVAALGGALGGEAAFFLARRGADPPGGALLVGELMAGACLVLVAAQTRRTRVIAFGASVAGAAAVADGALRVLMRAGGWGVY